MSRYDEQENQLNRADSIALGDLVRVLKDGTSRSMSLQNFITSFNAGGGVTAGNVITTTTNYLAQNNTNYLLCDTALTAITVTLPAVAASNGYLVTVKNIDGTNDVTVQTTGPETIDGSATDTLAGLSSAGYISDGSNWHIVNG